MISLRMSLLLSFLVTSSVTSMHGMQGVDALVVEGPRPDLWVCVPNYQCTNQTHEQFVNSVCYAVHDQIDYKSIYVTAVRAGAVSAPIIGYCIYGLEAIYYKTSLTLKQLIKIAACSALYSAACVYTFENHTAQSEAALWATTLLIGGGSVLWAEYLKRPGRTVYEERV